LPGLEVLAFRAERAIVLAMSLIEIEAQLDKLTPDELRHLALKSWTAFVEKEGGSEGQNECDEDDPQLLVALDEAIEKANATRGKGRSANEVRARLSEWTSK
jgi:hypothetical protein